MRTNLPITNIEHKLHDDVTIVSKTDLKGKITYVNQEFVHVSGFSESELLGAPHNIVRHPDMPPEAYRDLWATLQSGKAWSGIVKNRCKNGNYYWVEANAAPTIKDGKIVGFTSVRTKASAESIKAAEQVYRELNSPKPSIFLSEGRVYKRGLVGVCKRYTQIPISSRAFLFGLVLSLLYLVPVMRGLLANGSVDMFSVALAVFGVSVAAAMPVWMKWALLKPLADMASQIEKMSAGDLSGKIASHEGEIGTILHSVRILQTNIKLLVGQIKESSYVVNHGAHEIASGNEDLSSRTESQASALQQTASSMEELSSTVKNSAENAVGATKRMSSANEIAVTSGRTMESVTKSMEMIKDHSRSILDIIGVIDGIAFQTNILALNASVEAARAGENGRGFAVVAQEVRALATRSGQAAKEIKKLINETVTQIEHGGAVVDSAGAAIQELIAAVQDASLIIAEISSATQEQSAGIEQVTLAVGEMDRTTQKNAQLVDSASECANSLRAQADKLVGLVESFKIVRAPQLT